MPSSGLWQERTTKTPMCVHLSVREAVYRLTNLVQVLIDAERSARSLSRKATIDLVASLTGAFEEGNVVCVHAVNDVRLHIPISHAARLYTHRCFTRLSFLRSWPRDARIPDPVPRIPRRN